MPALFDKLTKEYYQSGFRPRTAEARAWFMGRLKSFNNVDARILMAQQTRLTPQAMMGGMFFFFYDAKMKDVLPYWDKFPLIIPVDFHAEHFYGINLHYVDPWTRATILDKLTEVSNNRFLDDNSRLRLVYNLGHSFKKFREVQPCIKKYLYTHVRSQFLKVEPKEWDVAIFLPVQQFVGAKPQEVWEDSTFK